MVKFAKQLEGSLVPEWKGAYCNYKELKRDVNRIKADRLLQSSDVPARHRSLGSFSQLHNLGNHLRRTAHELNPLSHGSDELGHNNSVDRNDVDDVLCETELIDPRGHGEQDRVFFNRLDAELEKINRFYKAKEGEYISRAVRLERQLLALFQVQEALARQNLKMRTSSFPKPRKYTTTDINSCFSSPTGYESPLLEIITVRPEGHKRESRNYSEESGCSSSGSSDEEMEIIANFIDNVDLMSERDNSDTSTSGESPIMSPSSRNSFLDGASSSSPLQMVQRKGEFNARMRQTREMVEHQGVTNRKEKLHSRERSIIQDMIDMSLGKKKVQSFERMLRAAFIEFYRGLGLLKSYSSLNMVAFAKIMKKYDKVGKHRFGPLYIREVEHSYFATSDKVTKLMTKVEEIFTKHFADHDRRKAMAQLRPMQQHGGHSVTYLLGIFSGTSLALLVGFLMLLSTTSEYRKLGGHKYMDTVFHVFSTLGLVLLHLYMYGLNVYTWQRARINYPFIFEFSPGSELRYREIFLVCTALTSLLLGTMIAHIIASTREIQRYSTSEFAPMAITLLFLAALFNPMNILYRPTRMVFLRCMLRVICAPFYKVHLADFFLGDQLTSQVASFRNLEFILCYYSGGYFQDRQEDACTSNRTFKALMYVFSLLPYWFRFLQCMRRWRDERDKMQLYNAGKYASAMIAVVIKLTYMFKEGPTWLVLFVIFSCFATLYQLYWDLVVDWGLLQRGSRNPWLRDCLVLKKKYIYFVSMGLNVVLRLAWVSSIQHVNMIPGFSQAGWDIIFASLEVIRRGHWNFYRLENEHLNNVGKFRAVKTVPLPFKEFEDRSV
ncbi:hypothetical protein KC19_8G064200 [Ceratodon purpureus]|uniref:Uncharacterized protein n=1 Tax=Ceratodon purpureus TaxID=3225 RepID=A0A8T0H1B8_CERPU|nr:hypothetical protein KC19_8G064200 [Ceratodon purpureus]